MSVTDAIANNDLPQLQDLIAAGCSINRDPNDYRIPLFQAIHNQKVEIFDYLLTVKDINVDAHGGDLFGKTPLLHLAFSDFGLNDYFALKLIENGADIHFTDWSGCSVLHRGAMSQHYCNNLKLGELFIKRGVDINSRNANGKTPLFFACKHHKLDWIHMLLYHGADATVPSDDGVLPLVMVLRDNSDETQREIEEILFNYTFGDDKVRLNLKNLVVAMTANSPIYLKIAEKVNRVTYSTFDLSEFQKELIKFKAEHLRHFITHFWYIMEEMPRSVFSISALLLEVKKVNWQESHKNFIEVLYVLTESQFAYKFLYSLEDVIALLVDVFPSDRSSLAELTKLVCHMVSYGLTVTTNDFYRVYEIYGYCELFKILQHMDIKERNLYNPFIRIQPVDADEKSERLKLKIIPILCHDFTQTIRNFLDRYDDYSLFSCLGYFAFPELKEICLQITKDDNLIAKVKKLPKVPHLTEFSRDVARKTIITRYQVKNSRQFCTIVRWLPIDNNSKAILRLERKLYDTRVEADSE